jgi:hypothetical protein
MAGHLIEEGSGAVGRVPGGGEPRLGGRYPEVSEERGVRYPIENCPLVE